MMPRDKAKELIMKFSEYAYFEDSGYSAFSKIEKAQLKENAKKCAALAVDEIIKAIDFDWMEAQNLERIHCYWEIVKEEIEKY